MNTQKHPFSRPSSHTGFRGVCWAIGLLGMLGVGYSQGSASEDSMFRGALLDASWLAERETLVDLDPRVQSIVVALDPTEDPNHILESLERLDASNRDFYYWIEIGRNERLADAHPEWMASIQTHPEWRRHYPKAPKEAPDVVIKAYPWVPIAYEETFEAHVDRVAQALEGLPLPKGVFLNDLQGPPSVCGCGNALCRWTTDYGPKLTAKPKGDEAAAEFLKRLTSQFTEIDWIPVWATECESRDKPTHCAGVGCYHGACWKAWTRQLEPVAEVSETIALLTLTETFLRTETSDISGATWTREALRMPQTEMRRHGRAPVGPERLITTIEGTALSPEEIQSQMDAARAAGARGWLLSLIPIEQSWEPKATPISAE